MNRWTNTFIHSSGTDHFFGAGDLKVMLHFLFLFSIQLSHYNERLSISPLFLEKKRPGPSQTKLKANLIIRNNLSRQIICHLTQALISSYQIVLTFIRDNCYLSAPTLNINDPPVKKKK